MPRRAWTLGSGTFSSARNRTRVDGRELHYATAYDVERLVVRRLPEYEGVRSS
ncbi:MAG TPA: hypothetical protein VFZ21_21030 [Gemmatimonadaceae bacterium]|nr:hypothetical protein [Gemmatimonadaceae bacterium]